MVSCSKLLIKHENVFNVLNVGINDWDNEDGDILRQVLAQSQQEYLDSLKRKARDFSPCSERASTSKAGLEAICSSSFKHRPEFNEGEQVCKKLKSCNESEKSNKRQFESESVPNSERKKKEEEEQDEEKVQCLALPNNHHTKTSH